MSADRGLDEVPTEGVNQLNGNFVNLNLIFFSPHQIFEEIWILDLFLTHNFGI